MQPFETIIIGLSSTVAIALVTQVILQFSAGRVQTRINADNEAQHSGLREACMAEAKRGDRNLQDAMASQKETSVRLEEGLKLGVTEQRETNKLLMKLVGAVENVTQQTMDQARKAEFTEARIRDLERIVAELKGAHEGSKKVA
jgi:hypothetical protein